MLEESALHKETRKKRKCNLVALANAEQHTLTNVVPFSFTEGPLQPQQKGKEVESDTPVSAAPPLEEVCDTRAEELLQKSQSVATRALRHREFVLQLQLDESRAVAKAQQDADEGCEQNKEMVQVPDDQQVLVKAYQAALMKLHDSAVEDMREKKL